MVEIIQTQEFGKAWNETTVGEDKPQLEPKPCKVIEVKQTVVKSKDGKEVGTKVVLVVSHPDRQEKLIEMSNVKYLKNDQLAESALWYNIDDSGKLAFKSALAVTLRFFHAKTIKDLIGISIPTIIDANGYLIIKAY